jgi:hypothetical protein
MIDDVYVSGTLIFWASSEVSAFMSPRPPDPKVAPRPNVVPRIDPLN